MYFESEILLRLCAATLLAGVIGWERKSLGKAAGLRTHLLVGLGSALAVAVGDGLIERVVLDNAEVMRVDPLRIMEAVLTGIGFLGAGTIMARRDEDRISGLTTAASIWATAVIGLTAGIGQYVLAAGATVIIFLILRGLGYLEYRKKLALGNGKE
jgi:putative Mg2+ transporter-C (MgtC) family protein